jgi:CelD/BcsL family acetyltransferase involved in cellulose biosynthesis
VARSLDEGLEMMRQLAGLHQARWESRGEAGAFSSAKFYSFHERLLSQDFDHVLLFRVQAGGEIVGMLHCFLHRRWVYYYQSGFCYSTDKRGSPGLLTLYHVVSRCLAQEGIDGFDFMAGDQRYKRSLTADTDIQTLSWRVVRRNTLPSLLFLGLRRFKRRYAEFRNNGRAKGQPQTGVETPAREQSGLESLR